MQPSDRSPDRLLLPALLAFSLAAHLALLAVPVTISVPQFEPRGEAITVEMLRLDAVPDVAAEVIAEDTPEPPEPQGLPSEPVAAVPVEELDPAPEPIKDRMVPAMPDLRLQAIDTARELAATTEKSPQAEAMTFRDAPRLPSAPGWLNQYTGAVTASVEHWQAADGSLHSRTVLANGQVVCATTRAPTMQEIFNPWMSVAVPMLRNCGRERPDPVDRNDPWLRAPSAGH